MCKIGVIDSGIGGFSLVKDMISSDIVGEYYYIFDNKYHPYGIKSKGELTALAYRHVSELMRHEVDMILFACNTLTSSCIDIVRNIFYLPIIGVEPPVKPAVIMGSNILVLATPFTVQGEKLRNSTLQYTEKNFYYPYIPELASIIENNIWRGRRGRDNIYGYLVDKLSAYTECDSVVIGCTHYNYIVDMLSDILPRSAVYTAMRGVSNRVREVMTEWGLGCDGEALVRVLPSGDNPAPELLSYIADYINVPVILDVPYYIT